MRWAGYVACMAEEKRRTQGASDERENLKVLRAGRKEGGWEAATDMEFQNVGWGYGMD